MSKIPALHRDYILLGDRVNEQIIKLKSNKVPVSVECYKDLQEQIKN